MIALAQGQSTGRIVRSCSADGVVVSTAHYAVAGGEPGEHYHQHSHLCLVMQGGDIERRGGTSTVRRAGDLHFYHAGESHATLVRERRSATALVEISGVFLKAHGLTESQFADAVGENLNAMCIMLKLQ